MVKRELYLKKIRPFVGTDVIKVITGMRRSGKSVLLEQIQEELKTSNPQARIFAVNLDDDENTHLTVRKDIVQLRKCQCIQGTGYSPAKESVISSKKERETDSDSS